VELNSSQIFTDWLAKYPQLEIRSENSEKHAAKSAKTAKRAFNIEQKQREERN
jgi:hypothetical protein